MTEVRAYTRVVLDPQPIRYGAHTPSMNRRGGVRVHPIKDGGLNMQSSQENIKRRDLWGAKLVDVIDPRTGFCVGVRSNQYSRPVNDGCVKPGVSGSPNAEVLRGLAGSLVDGQLGRVYYEPGEPSDQVKRVIRTVEMGDNPLPMARVSVPTESPKKKASGRVKPQSDPSGGAPRATRAPRPTRIPGATGTGGRITDSDCDALIRVMAGQRGQAGQNMKITPAMRKIAREVIKSRMKQAERVLRNS